MPNRSKAKSRPPWKAQIPQRVLMPTGPIWWTLTDRREAPIVWPLTHTLAEAAEDLINQLNMRPEESGVTKAQRWAMQTYADRGALPPLDQWPDDARKEATAALAGYQFRWARDGALCFGHFGPDADVTVASNTHRWIALGILQQHRVSIRACPGCQKFFADAGHRKKAACSPACGSKLRARTHFETLKTKPRKYRAYLKKQRELMKKRRAAGLAF